MSERSTPFTTKSLCFKAKGIQIPILLQTESIVSTFYACTAISVVVQNPMHDLYIEELDLVKLHILEFSLLRAHLVFSRSCRF